MRNLRLYNTDAAFKQHEQAAGGDGLSTETIVPGVSMSKDIRKRYFNPKDKNILVYNITANLYMAGSESGTIQEAKTIKVKGVSGISSTVSIISPNVPGWKPVVPYKTATIPEDTTIDFLYETRLVHKCIYNVTDLSTAALFYIKPSNNLSAITIDGVTYPESEITSSYRFSAGGIHKVIFHYTGSTTIPNNGFIDTQLESVELSESTSMINNSAFYNLTTLKSVKIPDSVTGIGHYAFDHCSNITELTFSKNVTSIGDYCFRNCHSLSAINLGDKLISIGNAAFADASSITEINIPSTITGIGVCAFTNCIKLVRVTGSLPLELKAFMFYNCGNLETIEIPYYKVTQYEATGSQCNSMARKTHTGYGFSSLGSYCFYGCAKLQLSNFNLISSGSTYATSRRGTSTSASTLSKNFVRIGAYAFYGCKAITNLNITVDNIVGVFEYVNSSDDCLSIVTGNTYMGIDSHAFEDSGLQSIALPSCISALSEYTFASCKDLTGITIPNKIARIEGYCFRYCTNLTEMTSNAANAPSVTYNTFRDIASNGTLYYHSGSDYSAWLSSNDYYLGKYGWTGQEI